jgi:aminocarboxymuconate-semialdehyde decarboxylase
MTKPEKIDLHTHVLPQRWPDLVERYGYEGFVRLDHHEPCRARMMVGDRVFRVIEENCWSAERRLEDCARIGVDVQVLSTVPVMFSYWARPRDALDLSRLLNDHIAEVCRAHPGRFVGLGTLPMQDPELAQAELERCMRPGDRGGLGLAGVEIGTHVDANAHQGRDIVWNLDEPAIFPVFQRAADLGAAVFVHPWDMLGKERMPRYWLPWLVGMPAETALAICSVIFGGVLERLPRLRLCFSHGGGSFPGTIGRIEHGFRVRPDLVAVNNPVSPRAYLAQGDGSPARFFVDSLVHDAEALRDLLRLFGERRVALGSDYPFPLGEHRPGELIDSLAELSHETRARLLGANAREFLFGERIAG